jgi:hypothetical protein
VGEPIKRSVTLLLLIQEACKSLVQMQKTVIIVLMLVAAAFWGHVLYLDSFYYQNAPREPVPAEGRIHPRVIHHGAHVFLTEREVFNFDVLFPSISIGSVLIAGLLAMRWKQFGFTKDFKGADLFSFCRKNKRT